MKPKSIPEKMMYNTVRLVTNRGSLGRFDISVLDCNEKYSVLRSDPEKYMDSLLKMAVIAGDRYAIERKRRLKK